MIGVRRPEDAPIRRTPLRRLDTDNGQPKFQFSLVSLAPDQNIPIVNFLGKSFKVFIFSS
jgi:hypothetical protein